MAEKDWRQVVRDMAVWDESHTAPAVELMQYEKLTAPKAIKQLEKDYATDRMRRMWREQVADDLAEYGLGTNEQLDEAYAVYVEAFLAASRARVMRGLGVVNPARRDLKVGDRVTVRGVPGTVTRVSPKIREFTFLADGGSVWDENGDEIRFGFDEAEQANPASVMTGPGWSSAREKLRSAAAKKNPSEDEQAEARDLYERFHRYPPTKIGEFEAPFEIPTTVFRAGRALWTTYRSGKVDPATLKLPKKPVNYIHEHDAGVEVYLTEFHASSLHNALDIDMTMMDEIFVPAEFANAEALVKLGDSLGYKFVYNDEEIEAEAVDPLPELYCTPDGKCLLVIQNKRELIAMIWGGALGVFPRGIDG